MFNDSDTSDSTSPLRLGDVHPRRTYNALATVHQLGCRVCKDYATHASFFDSEHDPDIIMIGDKREKSEYLSGFRAGRAAQQKHDSTRLKEYRQQREEARNLKLVYELELKEAKEQILLLRSELLALRLSSTSSWDSDPGYSDNSDLSAPEYESSSEEEGELDFTEEETKFDQEHKYDGKTSGPLSYVLDEPLDHQPQATQDSSVIHQSTVEASSSSEGESTIVEEAQLAKQPKPTDIPTSIPTATFDNASYTIEEIKKMMFLAHKPDRSDMLIKVKSIVSKAHATPVFQRTLVQDYLMREWRRPGIPLFEQESKIPLEVFVDASNIGIGLSVGNKWRSWALKEGWKTREREIQWAEAAAVDLGLRSMVEAGHIGKNILMRSDNAGVVHALQNRTFHCPQTGEIIKEIYAFCSEWGIQLQVKWVPGEKNPADAPSRMRSGNPDQRFAHVPQIPAHLQQFVYETK